MCFQIWNYCPWKASCQFSHYLRTLINYLEWNFLRLSGTECTKLGAFFVYVFHESTLILLFVFLWCRRFCNSSLTIGCFSHQSFIVHHRCTSWIILWTLAADGSLRSFPVLARGFWHSTGWAESLCMYSRFETRRLSKEGNKGCNCDVKFCS